jgi:hypothetical protein
MFSYIHTGLHSIGKIIAGFCMAILALSLLLGPFAAAIWVCAHVGAWGGQLLGKWMFFPITLLAGLFLSIYVWPHLKPAYDEAAEVIQKHLDQRQR